MRSNPGLSRMLLVVSLLASGLSQACATRSHEATQEAVAPLTGEWILVGFAPGHALPPGAAAPTFVVAESGRISGFTGVNTYTGQLNLSELRIGRFETGPLAATLMAGAPEAMDVEQHFLQALGEADACRVKGTELTLTHNGNDVARFRRK